MSYPGLRAGANVPLIDINGEVILSTDDDPEDRDDEDPDNRYDVLLLPNASCALLTDPLDDLERCFAGDIRCCSLRGLSSEERETDIATGIDERGDWRPGEWGSGGR